jgi:hypothetical protein
MSTATGDGLGTMAARPPVPRSAEEITPEWLTGALQAHGRDVVVHSIRRTPLGEGVGMMSLLEHVEVDYARGEGPATMVLKLPATNEANRAVALAFDIYRRETLFYRDVAALTPAATPEVYVSEIDGKDAFVLLLEDLGHYRLGDQIEGCALADAELCMVELGELHATFWDDVDRPELEFLPYHHPSHHSEGLRQGAAAGWDPMLEVFGDVVPAPLAALKDRFLAAIPRMQEWITTPPLTVVHGDFRMDNLFFGTTPDEAPVAAVDWQGALRAKAVQDLGYLLGGSVEVEDRRAHERDLIAKWHDTLGEGGVEDYSLDQAWEDYLRSLLYQWTVTVVIAGTLDPSNDRGRAWMTRMVDRHATAIEDHDLRSLLPEFE